MSAYLKSILFLCIILTSCVSVPKPKERLGRTDFYSLDFREYSEAGFLITPYPPNNKYQSKGLIEVHLKPKVLSISKATYYGNENQEYTNPTDGAKYELKAFRAIDEVVYYYAVEIIDANQAVKEIYLKAKEYGADAIVNFKIISETEENFGLEFHNIIVSGFAIKTLD
ncbi:hypothetical protein [Owenweeksia hongkongensis]|uniref:hypothetical protein n=1 Tax=Owenweeksia hongkongensis TaxID=253245 RepID=UPI003A8E0E4B